MKRAVCVGCALSESLRQKHDVIFYVALNCDCIELFRLNGLLLQFSKISCSFTNFRFARFFYSQWDLSDTLTYSIQSIYCSKIQKLRLHTVTNAAWGAIAPTLTTNNAAKKNDWTLECNQMRISYPFFGPERYEWVCVYAYTFLTIKLPHCQCIYFMLLPLAFWSRNKSSPVTLMLLLLVACAENKPAIKCCSAIFQMRVHEKRQER